VEAQVVGRVFVERHVPKSAGNVETEHPVVRLEQMMKIFYLLVTAREFLRKHVDPPIVVDHTLLS
jgi:hypothetical protein